MSLRINTKLSQLVVLFLTLTGCQYDTPRQHDDICQILDTNIGWYYAAKQSSDKWGIPIALQLAIIQRESGFTPHARTQQEWLFGIIPWGRESTSYGYSQAINATWDEFIKKNKYSYAFRNSFWDATDFIGWYLNEAHKRADIHKYDAKNLYLAYHVGIVGFNRKDYESDPKLVKIAEEVTQRAIDYQRQLKVCEPELDRYWYYPIF